MVALSEFVLSFFLGIGATAAPCILPLYPGFLAYLSGSASKTEKRTKVQYLGFLVLLGVLSMMLVLGFIIASLSVAAGQVVGIVTPIADIIIILLGILMLLNRNIFLSLPKLKIPIIKSPYANSYVYGLLYGPVALPCSGPFLVSIFAITFQTITFADKLLLFFVFGLGFGIPLFALSLIATAKSQFIISKFVAHQKAVNRIAGIILIAVGLYDFSINYEFLMLYLLR